jgi:hypothetical protein
MPPGERRLSHVVRPTLTTGPGTSEFTSLIDGQVVGRIASRLGFANFISWSGPDKGRDRGSPVSHYDAPCGFTGKLSKVTMTMHDDRTLDGEGIGLTRMARE